MLILKGQDFKVGHFILFFFGLSAPDSLFRKASTYFDMSTMFIDVQS